jgi:transcriptional regulator GlxA family with amidase domain
MSARWTPVSSTPWSGWSGSWTPTDARFLAPLIKREIVYRLLVGPQGDRIRQVATLGGEANRITRAIEQLRSHFDRPLRIEEMASDLGRASRASTTTSRP